MRTEAKEARVFELVTRYLDNGLTETEVEELNEVISGTDEDRDLVEEIFEQAYGLARLRSEAEQATVTQLHGRRKPLRAWIPIAIAASIVVIASLFFVGQDPEPVAFVTFGGGEGRLWHLEESSLVQVVNVDVTQPIFSGYAFRVDDAEGWAELRFPDGTEIRFHQAAEATLNQVKGQKILHLRQGQITADVAPQRPGRPFQIETPSSRLDVLGTELEVSATQSATDLVVTHGRVAMFRQSDGQYVEVGAGQRATAAVSDSLPLVATEVPPLPDRWHRDFGEEPGETWGGGKWQSDGTMLAFPRFDLGYSHFAVVSNNAWSDGLHSHFQVHADSTLEFRFKMEKPQWFLVRLGLRATPFSERKFGGNAFYQSNDWHRDLQPNEWRTVKIPLTEIHHFGNSERNDIDIEGLGAFLISISSQNHDVGLVIDEIRVDRGTVAETFD